MKKTPAASKPIVYRCPKCDANGKPFNVKTHLGAVELFFRCAHCNHTWTIRKPNLG